MSQSRNPFTQFQTDADRVTADDDRRSFLRSSMRGYINTRSATQDRFMDYESARIAAGEIKWEAIENLDFYLAQFADNLAARGTVVHWCENSEEARVVILEILKKHDAKTVIKSKCMTTEEIHLNDLLDDEGFEVVESDLGEFIVQLR